MPEPVAGARQAQPLIQQMRRLPPVGYLSLCDHVVAAMAKDAGITRLIHSAAGQTGNLRIGTGPRGNYIHAGMGGLYYRQTLMAPKRGRSRAGASLPAMHESGHKSRDCGDL